MNRTGTTLAHTEKTHDRKRTAPRKQPHTEDGA
jgi:hypothetical protein